MKVEKSIIDGRRAEIKKLLMHKGSVLVKDLACSFGTSQLTIRRDLDALEQEGGLVRFYGGAALTGVEEDNVFSSRLTLHKHAIAKEAAKLVEDGDTIFLNTSSTALLLLRYIAARQVTVITNNGKAIFADKSDPDMIVVLTGGELRVPKDSMVGEFALNSLSRVTAGKCFIGCAGLTVDEGVTTGILQEAAINEMMITRTTGARVIVADCQKIGRRHSFAFGAIDTFDTLITDTQANPEVLARLTEKKVHVVQVPPIKRL